MSNSDSNRKRKRKRESPDTCTLDCKISTGHMPHSHVEIPSPVYKHVDATPANAMYTPEIDKHVLSLQSGLMMELDVDSFLEIPTCRLRKEFPNGIPFVNCIRTRSNLTWGIGSMLLAWKDLLSEGVVLALSDIDKFKVVGDDVFFETSHDTAGENSVRVGVDSITRVEWSSFYASQTKLNSLCNIEHLLLVKSMCPNGYQICRTPFTLPRLRRLGLRVTKASFENTIHVLRTHTLLEHIHLEVDPFMFFREIALFSHCLSSLSVVDIDFNGDHNGYITNRDIYTLPDISETLLCTLHSVRTLRVRLSINTDMTHRAYKLFSTHPTLTMIDLPVRWTARYPPDYRVHDLFVLQHSGDSMRFRSNTQECVYYTHNQRVLTNRKVWGSISIIRTSTKYNEGSKMLDSVLDLVPMIIGFAGLDSIDACVFPFD